jgi:hypothetical protein
MMIVIANDSLLRIFSCLLSGVFILLCFILYQVRTFRITFIERKVMISVKDKICSIVYCLLLIPATIFFSYGDLLFVNDQFYVPSDLVKITWLINTSLSLVLFFYALLSRSHFRIFIYLPFVIMFVTNFLIILDNVILKSVNLMACLWFGLLFVINIMIIFVPPSSTLINDHEYAQVIFYFYWKKK